MKTNRKRVVRYFCEMVSISSESGNEGVFAKYLLRLASDMGFRTDLDKSGNVYIYVSGEGEPLMLNTHMDTVSPGLGIKPIVKNGIIKSGGNTILGADPKITIAAFFEILFLVKEKKITTRPLVITLTRNEESGIPTANLIKSEVRECVVPDRGTPLGEIIVESPYAQVFEVIVRGKSAYATTDFAKGRHAILSAANSIKNVPVGNFDELSTANIGKIFGGTVNTVVPNECTFTGNCYSFSEKSIGKFFRVIDSVLEKSDGQYGTKSTLKMLEYFGGFNINRNEPIVTRVVKAISQSGLKPKFKRYKAVSNANLLNGIGIKTVLISNGVRNQHSTEENILIEDLVRLTKIVGNIVFEPGS